MLGAVLRKAREDAKLTQEQVSVAARINRSYISQLENDKKSPTVDLLFRICDAIGCKASSLIAAVEPARKPKVSKPVRG